MQNGPKVQHTSLWPPALNLVSLMDCTPDRADAARAERGRGGRGVSRSVGARTDSARPALRVPEGARADMTRALRAALLVLLG